MSARTSVLGLKPAAAELAVEARNKEPTTNTPGTLCSPLPVPTRGKPFFAVYAMQPLSHTPLNSSY